jgi:glucans biosynthesis protein C
MTDETRYHSLDAVRAFALLSGIALHATMSFLPGFRAARWPISDDSSSLALAVLFFVVHIFRMSVFFAIAGFFARLLLERLGTAAFIKNRLLRIGLPFVLAMVLVLPLTILPLIWGAKQLQFAGPPLMSPPIPQRGVPWGHLWFLYLLLQMYAALLITRVGIRALNRPGRGRALLDGMLRGLLASRLAPLVLAAPLAAALYFTPWWQMWGGIPTPIMGFVPNGPAVVGFGSALLFGWFLHRQPSLLELLKRDWLLYAIAAASLSVAAILLIGAVPRFAVVAMSPAQRLACTITYTVALWAWVFTIIGVAMEYCAAHSPRWRYLSDASFWMYLIHVPIVWGLQAWMIRWPLHWSIKYPLVLAMTMTLLLASYRYLVRGTFVGKLLNGRKYPRATPATLTAPNIYPV